MVTEGKEKPSVIYTEGFVYAAEFPRIPFVGDWILGKEGAS